MGSCSQGPTFVSSTWNLDTLAQIGAAPAEHLRVAAEFLERIVNMGIKAIMGIKVAATWISSVSQDNLWSPRRHRRHACGEAQVILAVAEEERLKGWGSLKQST